MRFDIISGRMPETVEIGGKEYGINHDFRVGIKMDAIRLSDKEDHEKLQEMLLLYYPEVPEDIVSAIDKMLWFYRGGEEIKEEKKQRYQRKTTKEPAYSFSQDAPYIYAAFKEQYRIDLSSGEYMHWWKFLALFESLNEDTKMCKIMYYRKVSTSGMPPDRRAFINEMKKLYSLDKGRKLTLEERNQKWRDYIKERYKMGKEGQANTPATQ